MKRMTRKCLIGAAISHARISAKFRQLFFTGVQCGLGNRSGERATNFAGSFPPVKSIAGGSRARERQKLGLNFELNSFTP
jgi:hypothetical protein